MPLDYDKAYKERYRKNVLSVQDQSDLDLKIHNFCEVHDRLGFTEDEVRDQIEKNNIVAACFATDPTKQRIYKHSAAEYIKNDIVGISRDISDFKEFRHRKLSVAEALGKDGMARRSGLSKERTIDFKWKYEGVQFYASHKYMKEDGGSQGRSYKEIQNFIKAVPRRTQDGVRFLAIADGDFYKGKYRRDKTRFQHLKELARQSGGPVQVCTINGLEELLPQIAGQGNRK